MNFAKFLKTPFFTEHLRTTTSADTNDKPNKVNRHQEKLLHTTKNTAILPDFLVQKFCGKVQFRAIRPKLCGNCAFPQNFHTRKSGKIMVFFAVSAINTKGEIELVTSSVIYRDNQYF